MAQALIGVAALFGADDHHRATAEPAQPANHRGVVAKRPVAGQGHEIADHGGQDIFDVRAVGMTRDLDRLPRGELLVNALKLAFDFALQFANFLGNVDVTGSRQVLQLFDFAFEIGDRFLEVQEIAHGNSNLVNGRAR